MTHAPTVIPAKAGIQGVGRGKHSRRKGLLMPSDEVRRLLKVFGIAVTTLEDAVHDGAAADRVARSAADARQRLDELAALIERLEKESR